MRTVTRTSALLLTATLAVAAPLLGACGGVTSQVTEQAAEQAAEQAVGGNVDIEDGSVTMTDEEGNQVAVGENIELPADWPASVPAPDGGTLMMAGVDPQGGASAMWNLSGTPDEVADAYAAQLEAAGFTKDAEAMMDTAAMRQFTGNGLQLSVSANEADGQTGLLVVVVPEGS